MPAVLLRSSRRTLRFPVRSAVVFILFYLYVWLRIGPALIYDAYWVTGRFPLFLRGPGFFTGLLTHPGGLVEYVSAWLCQFYYYDWAGALAITAVAALLCLATWWFIAAVSEARPGALHLAPAVLLLLLYDRYDNPMPTALALVAAVLCADVYVFLPLRRAGARFAAFAVLCGVLCYVAAGAALMYAVLCGIFEVGRERRWLGLIYAGGAIAILLAVAALIFRTGVAEAHARLLPPFQPPSGPAVALLAQYLYLFFPLAALGMTLQRRLAGRSGRVADDGVPSGPPSAGARSARKVGLKLALEPCLLLVMAAVPVWLCFDAAFGRLLRVEHCARRRLWPELLDEASRLPARLYDVNVRWHVNRALHHTGRLPYEMFSYPQDRLSLVPSPRALRRMKVKAIAYMRFSDILIELGRVNDAEHWAHEALAKLGDRPEILRRLAVINIVKRQPEPARVLLRALEKDVAHAKWARERLRRMAADPFLSDDGEVRRIRSRMMATDAAEFFDPDAMLVQLLEENRANRMAFEYLMAHYLLEGNLEGVVRNISRLDDLGYPDIPRHYEEALLIYMDATGQQVDLGPRRISHDTRERFGRFKDIIARHGPDTMAARDALPIGQRNSYFAYYEFVVKGAAE